MIEIYENVAISPSRPLRVNCEDHWLTCKVYLNGFVCAEALEADAIEGWVKVIARPFGFDGNGDLLTRTLRGEVELEWKGVAITS